MYISHQRYKQKKVAVTSSLKINTLHTEHTANEKEHAKMISYSYKKQFSKNNWPTAIH